MRDRDRYLNVATFLQRMTHILLKTLKYCTTNGTLILSLDFFGLFHILSGSAFRVHLQGIAANTDRASGAFETAISQ